MCRNNSCSVKFVDLKCDSRRRYFRHLGNDRTQQLMSAEFEMNVRPTNPTGAPTQPPVPCGTTTTHCKCIHKFYMYREQVISNLSSTNCTASIIPLQRIGMICKQLLVTWMSACYQSVVCLTLGGLHQA